LKVAEGKTPFGEMGVGTLGVMNVIPLSNDLDANKSELTMLPSSFDMINDDPFGGTELDLSESPQKAVGPAEPKLRSESALGSWSQNPASGYSPNCAAANAHLVATPCLHMAVYCIRLSSSSKRPASPQHPSFFPTSENCAHSRKH
jgi:hypothetical protein